MKPDASHAPNVRRSHVEDPCLRSTNTYRLPLRLQHNPAWTKKTAATRLKCGGALIVLSLFLFLAPSAATAQTTPITFGSADDPREQLQRVWWKREQTLHLFGGFSLIGPRWHGAGMVTAEFVTRSFTSRLNGTLRAGYFGEYSPDVDEPYDALRLLDFIRYEPPDRTPLHLRAGLIRRVRLGTGHMVNFFASDVAWDERTVGAEVHVEGDAAAFSAFTDNALLDGVTGGRMAFRPFFSASNVRWATATLGLNYVTDFAHRPDGLDRLEGYNIDAQFVAFRSSSVDFVPFASYAWYRGYGRGIGFGAELISHDFIDLLSFQLRMALFYNGRQFYPGYVGTFYTVSNRAARTLDVEGSLAEQLVGVPLEAALGGNDLLTEFRLLISDRFEFWYAFRRHYGTQRLGEYHLHTYLRVIDRVRLNVGIDRNGVGHFLTLFSDLDEQSALVFGIDARLLRYLWIHIDARYTFERLADAPNGEERYLVQRRFEPLTGIRMRF